MSDTATEQTGEQTSARTSTKPRLQTRYREEIIPAMQDQFHYANVMPCLGWSRSW